MMLWKCGSQYASKFGKFRSGHRTGNGQFSFQSQWKAMPKKVPITTQLHSFHMLSRLFSKSFKLDFSSIWTENFQDVQAGFRKGRGTRDQIANICWITEKARKLKKNVFASASLTTLKPLTMWSTANWGIFLKRWDYQTTLPASWEMCMWVKKQ